MGLAALLGQNFTKTNILNKRSMQRNPIIVFYACLGVLLLLALAEMLLVLDSFPTGAAAVVLVGEYPAATAQTVVSFIMGTIVMVETCAFAYFRKKAMVYLKKESLPPGSPLSRLEVRLRYTGTVAILLLVGMMLSVPLRTITGGPSALAFGVLCIH